MYSIRKKLIITFTLSFGLLISIFCILSYSRSCTYFETLARNNVESELKNNIESLESYIELTYGELTVNYNSLTTENNLDLSEDSKVVDRIQMDFDTLATIFVKNGDNFERISTNVKGKNGSSAIHTLLDTSSDAYKALSSGNDYTGLATIEGNDYEASYKLLKNKNGVTVGAIFVGVSADDLNAIVDNAKSSLRFLFIILAIIFIVLTEILVLMVCYVLCTNLITIKEFFDKVKKLDVSEDVPKKVLAINDEIGEIGRATQEVVVNIRSFMTESNKLALDVSNYSVDLMNNMDLVNSTANEISTVVTQIADGASKQAKDTEYGSISISDLTTGIENNKNMMTNLNSSIQKVQKYKNEGINIITDLKAYSLDTSKAANSIYEVIQDTDIKAKEIKQSSQMIKDIAEQTNLLALNAAIEAARAGEEGKGFAVVAEEIRKLAEESNKFTEEIQVVINNLTTKTERAVITVTEMENVLKKQTTSVELTSNKFQGIADSIDETLSAVESLNNTSTAMERQKDSIIEIIENLSAIAEENAASTEEVAASVEEQTASICEFNNSVSNLANLSQKLQENIKKFKY